MSGSFSVYGISTGLLEPGDDIIGRVISSLENTNAHTIQDSDILLFAESPLSTIEMRNVRLADVTPSKRAEELGKKYQMNPQIAEVVIGDRKSVV